MAHKPKKPPKKRPRRMGRKPSLRNKGVTNLEDLNCLLSAAAEKKGIVYELTVRTADLDDCEIKVVIYPKGSLTKGVALWEFGETIEFAAAEMLQDTLFALNEMLGEGW